MVREQASVLSPEVIWKYSSAALADAVRAPPLSPEGQRPASAVDEARDEPAIVVIEKQALLRECLSHAIRSVTEQRVLSFSTVESWLRDSDDGSAAICVLCTGSNAKDTGECQEQLLLLSKSSRHISIVLLSDQEDPDRIVEALEQGARGYILTSDPLDVAIEAMRLVGAGGTFVPARSFVEARRSVDRPVSTQIGGVRLTTRQVAVVEALRRGKANKVIAYELNMRESTVKVHVRNIMKKFNARNRTEVAFIASGLSNNLNRR